MRQFSKWNFQRMTHKTGRHWLKERATEWVWWRLWYYRHSMHLSIHGVVQLINSSHGTYLAESITITQPNNQCIFTAQHCYLDVVTQAWIAVNNVDVPEPHIKLGTFSLVANLVYFQLLSRSHIYLNTVKSIPISFTLLHPMISSCLLHFLSFFFFLFVRRKSF